MSYAYATNEEENELIEDKESSNYALDITEIRDKLNSYYESNNYKGYLDYLNSLPINDLPQDFLEYESDRLNGIFNFNLKNKFQFKLKDHLKNFFIPFTLLFMSIINFFNNYNRVLLTIINGYLIVDFSYRIASITRSYFKEKKEFYARISDETHQTIKIMETITQALNNTKNHQETPLEEPQKNISKGMIKEIGKQELSDRIAYIRSLITTLPNQEEPEYLERLEKAIEEYNRAEDLDFKSTISLELNNKLHYLYSINKELDSIEKDIEQRKNLFVTNEEFKKILATSITNYLGNIASSSDKVQAFINIQNLLVGLESNNIMRNIEISHAYAECFWETIKVCDEDESQAIINMSNIISEMFKDSIITRGEYELDRLEQTLEVLSARTSLLRLKESINDNDEQYTKKEHIRYMVLYIRKFNKSKQEIRTRELNN